VRKIPHNKVNKASFLKVDDIKSKLYLTWTNKINKKIIHLNYCSILITVII